MYEYFVVESILRGNAMMLTDVALVTLTSSSRFMNIISHCFCLTIDQASSRNVLRTPCKTYSRDHLVT